MSDPMTPPADAAARLTAQMLDPWERVRCLPRCRSDEPMNHAECDCGSQQFVNDLRTLLAAYADAARDRERVEWLEAQAKPHHGLILCAQVVSGETPWASVQRVDHRHNPHKVEWCHESHDLRAAIDAARTGEAR